MQLILPVASFASKTFFKFRFLILGDTRILEELATIIETLVDEEKEALNLVRPAMSTSPGLTKVLKIVKAKFPKQFGMGFLILFVKFVLAVKSFVLDFSTDITVAINWFGYHTAMTLMGANMTRNSCPIETDEEWISLLQGSSWNCSNATFTSEEKVNCIYKATDQIQRKTNLIAEECKLDQKYLMESDGWGALFSISILTIALPLIINFGRSFYRRCKKSSNNLSKCGAIIYYLKSFIQSVVSEIYLKFEVLKSKTNLLTIESTSKKERIEAFKSKQPAGLENQGIEMKEKEDFDERKSTAKETIQDIESEEAEILYISISLETYPQFFFQSLVTLFPAFLLALVTYFREKNLYENYKNFSSNISSSGITIETISLIFGYMNICQVCCKLKMREKNKSFSVEDWKTLGCVLLYSTCDIVVRIFSTGLLAFLLSPTNQFLWWVAILVYVIHTGLMVILHFTFTPPKARNAWAIMLNAMSSFYTYNRPIKQTEELNEENRHRSKLQENLSKILASTLWFSLF